jgi:hypothetical protein
MQLDKNFISQFSKHLFWDTNPDDLDPLKHDRYIILKVLLYGLYPDWQLIYKFYPLESIVQAAKSARELDKRTAAFVSLISGVPKEQFLCYATNASAQRHWNF